MLSVQSLAFKALGDLSSRHFVKLSPSFGCERPRMERGRKGWVGTMIFELCPSDSGESLWLFYHDENDREQLVVRPEYLDLVCPSCGKIEEDAAIRRGVSRKFRVNSNKDWIGTSENWNVVSQRFRKIIGEAGIQGLHFDAIPMEPEYYVLTCTCLVETDEEEAGFEVKNRCGACGRYAEKYVGPLMEGLAVPENAATFFASCVSNESIKSAFRPLFAPGLLVRSLREFNLVGVEYLEAL